MIKNKQKLFYWNLNNTLAFGFLPGEEVLDAGIANAGIRDRKHFMELNEYGIWLTYTERFALEWVHENIDKFGGDPSKVVL